MLTPLICILLFRYRYHGNHCIPTVTGVLRRLHSRCKSHSHTINFYMVLTVYFGMCPLRSLMLILCGGSCRFGSVVRDISLLPIPSWHLPQLVLYCNVEETMSLFYLMACCLKEYLTDCCPLLSLLLYWPLSSPLWIHLLKLVAYFITIRQWHNFWPVVWMDKLVSWL